MTLKQRSLFARHVSLLALPLLLNARAALAAVFNASCSDSGSCIDGGVYERENDGDKRPFHVFQWVMDSAYHHRAAMPCVEAMTMQSELVCAPKMEVWLEGLAGEKLLSRRCFEGREGHTFEHCCRPGAQSLQGQQGNPECFDGVSRTYESCCLFEPSPDPRAHRPPTGDPSETLESDHYRVWLAQQLAAMPQLPETPLRYVLNTRYALQPHDRSVEKLARTGLGGAPLSGDGLWLEFGVYVGSSIRFTAGYTADTIYGFDSFEGIPVHWRPGFQPGFFDLKKQLPEVPAHVTLVPGWFNESLPAFLAKGLRTRGDTAVAPGPGFGRPVHLIHIDSDLYTSAALVLELLGEQMVGGVTVLVFDELINFPGWPRYEFRALYEFLARRNKLHDLRWIGRLAGCPLIVDMPELRGPRWHLTRGKLKGLPGEDPRYQQKLCESAAVLIL